MADKETPEGGEKTTEPVTTAAPEKPKAETKVEPAKAKATEPAKATKEEPEKPAVKEIGEDDELPEDEQLLQLSKRALTTRLNRHTKKELKERFGTDDYDDIKAKLDKLAAFEDQAEKARLKSLSDLERAKEETKAEKARADAAVAEHQKLLDRQAFSEYDGIGKAAIAKHFADDPDIVEFALDRLKKHVVGLDDADLEKPEKAFDAWAKDYVKKHPKYAKPAAEEVPTIKLTNGATPQRPEKASPTEGSKTARPGAVNSMSKSEYAAFKKQRGLVF